MLQAHASALDGDFAAYHNHAYRVLNLCASLSDVDSQALEKVAIAAAFHDLGIWTAGSFDYLQPSMKMAAAHLAGSGRSDWVPEVKAMVLEHHKLSRYRAHPGWLVEPFRKADLVDLSRGLITFGLPGSFLADLFLAWPSAGFHRRLVQLSLTRLRTHPWSPLPMVRL